MSEFLQQIKEAVVLRRPKEIEDLVRAAVANGENLDAVMNDGLIAAMDVVGKQFGSGEIFVPEMLVSAMIMKKGLEVVKPLLAGQAPSDKGTIIMATVKGDLHDIGKNIVCMMLEGAGFRVIDLGVDQTVETLVQKVVEIKPQVVGLSALLTTTMPEMKKVIEALTEKGLRGQVKVMVGGAPVDDKFARQIGADGYAADAAQAVEIARGLVAAA
ncbi:MAG: cobalamin B12-binding domain-containing protein [Thermodesulfobacteriota bacterium]